MMINSRNISYGKHCPEKVNFIVEISKGESHVKYEFDEDLGVLRLDRFLTAPMNYPCNYGYIPSTVAGDGDALDALLLSTYAILPCTLVECRPVAVIRMEDEAGVDDKVILVPDDKNFDYIQNLNDISSIERGKIEHFFKHYKELEGEKWSSVKEWGDVVSAKKIIQDSIVLQEVNNE